MFGEMNPLLWGLGGVVFVGVLLLLLRSQFSAEARLRRRRRKNYGHTVSKGKGPTVKLAVKAEELKD
jgi:hypothetical protein